MKSKELFPAIFSRHAAAYQERLDEIMARGEARGRERVIDVLQVEPGMRVLDLACGPGTLTKPLAARVTPGGVVVGVDLAPGMIELARARGIADVRFEVMDIEHLAFPDAAFDASAFQKAAMDSGFVRTDVELVEEKVVWKSAEQLVARCMSWWDLASRLDALPVEKRQAFVDDAVTSVRRDHPGQIETFGRNHVLSAIA